jgi:DDE superfamily endonuclease
MSGRTAGATHDSLAFSVSALWESLANSSLPDGYWIAGDEAYNCSDSLLTPWPSSVAKTDVAKDAFNFYQSSLRIHIEQAFGQLVRRFGILWKPIQFSIHSVHAIVHACMCIHNFIIDQREVDDNDDGVDTNALVQSSGGGDAEFAEWWSRTAASEESQGRRRDLERSGLREILTEHLKLRGDTRPC